MDLESRLLKTLIRKRTLDSIRFKLHPQKDSKGNPRKLRGWVLDLIESRVFFLVDVFKSMDSRSNVFFSSNCNIARHLRTSTQILVVPYASKGNRI